jgi:hypothetical protein
MARHRLTAWVVILLILGATLPLRAEEEIRILSDVRAEVEANRQRHSLLSVELNDGTLLTGSVGSIRKNGFAIITGLHARQSVGYSKIQAFVDPETGQTVALVQQAPWPSGRVISPRAKLIVVIVAAAVATFYIVALVIVTHAK